jgi:uncharacterized SAM-binding protein YcdF (DUF218 family)
LARRKNSTLFAELGPGGLTSLTLAFSSGFLGLGLPVVWRGRQVVAGARGEPLRLADAIVVLGRELVDDRPTPVFRARLEHALDLFRADWAPEIIVSGGMTGRATRSEAAAGREHLLRSGAPPHAVSVEERSRHTLENLFNVRETLRARGLERILLVSDPLHLARAAAFARGLALDVCCSPAVNAPPARGTFGWWLRAGREGFLLHWYRVGLAYSRAIGSERLLSRVT